MQNRMWKTFSSNYHLRARIWLIYVLKLVIIAAETMLLHPVDPGCCNVCQVAATPLCSGPPINVKSRIYDLKLVGLDLPIGEALTGIVQSWAAVHHILRP